MNLPASARNERRSAFIGIAPPSLNLRAVRLMTRRAFGIASVVGDDDLREPGRTAGDLGVTRHAQSPAIGRLWQGVHLPRRVFHERTVARLAADLRVLD